MRTKDIPLVLSICSDGPGLDFSGFGRAWAFMYRASGGPGFFVSVFGRARAFPKQTIHLFFCLKT